MATVEDCVQWLVGRGISEDSARACVHDIVDECAKVAESCGATDETERYFTAEIIAADIRKLKGEE